MNTSVKHAVILGVVGAVLLVFGAYLFRPVINVEPIINVEPVIERELPPLGAIPGTEVDSNYFSIGGVDYFHFGRAIAATSSVFCSVQNPFRPATTTILSVGTRITETISAASTYDIATGTTAYQNNGTSTPALTRAHAVGAAAKETYTWTPRYSTTTSGNIFDGELAIPDTDDREYPYFLTGNEYLNWKLASSTPGTDYYGGECTALLRKS